MTIFDTNALLRFILQDIPESADLVEKQLQQKSCFVPTEVVAEMVFVLSSVYKIPRNEIADAILAVLAIENITVANPEAVTKGLEVFAETTFDFVDCLMAGYSKEGYSVFTFDKKLKKYLQKSAATDSEK